MSQLGEILYLSFKELGFSFDKFLISKTQRIIFQKYSYLMNKYFDLGITGYSIYINGPYSSDLADVGYDIANIQSFYEEKTEDRILKDNYKESLKIIKDIFNDDSTLLEVYCTYRYLIDESGYKENDSITLEKVKKIKSHLISSDEFINETIPNIDKQLNERLLAIGVS